MEVLNFVESLEIAITENHGVVSGSDKTIDLSGVIEHNTAVYEHFETLSEHLINIQLQNHEGRLYGWWRSGVITDTLHNEMLNEARIKAIQVVKSRTSA